MACSRLRKPLDLEGVSRLGSSPRSARVSGSICKKRALKVYKRVSLGKTGQQMSGYRVSGLMCAAGEEGSALAGSDVELCVSTMDECRWLFKCC